jgi:class 3 adenylate cyclase
LSGLFTRPIGRLLAATKRIAAGDLDVQVDVNSKDELGELGRSFNEMSRSLKEKEQNLQLKVQENEDLLLNVLPPSAVKQFQDGDRSFADVYADVTLIYAEIEGFSDLVSKTDVSQSLQKLNELMGAFDEAAEYYGIEKLKTVGTAYIAVCGLSIPRVDHAKRSVDFAIAMLKTIQTFSASQASHVTLDIGIHSGGIVGGIVGKSKFIYELWGDTMKVVHAIHSSPEEDVIQVTEPVLQALDKVYQFKSVPSVFVKGLGEIPVWELDLSSSATTTHPDREGVLA